MKLKLYVIVRGEMAAWKYEGGMWHIQHIRTFRREWYAHES